jgi:hypothetical protein
MEPSGRTTAWLRDENGGWFDAGQVKYSEKLDRANFRFADADGESVNVDENDRILTLNSCKVMAAPTSSGPTSSLVMAKYITTSDKVLRPIVLL